MARRSTAVALLLTTLLLHFTADVISIGVNYGTIGNNLPKPAEVVNFLKTKTTIDRVRIFDANPEILRAFANSNIAVTVTVGNGAIPSLTQLAAAKQWVASNISPFYPQTKIIRILVGNEILQEGVREQIYGLVPAMRALHQALTQAGIKNIQVTTPQTLSNLGPSEPPSITKFKPGYDRDIVLPMLQFLRETKSPYMINPYPHIPYTPDRNNYALFKPNPGIYDQFTKLTYTNMFDAMLDATYSAMKAFGYGDVEIAVGETGWPSAGEPNQPYLNVDNAGFYNLNLIKHVSSRKGTPLMPNRSFETYIFGLFNENMKPGPNAERNFGLFKPDFTPVYDAGIMLNGQGAKPAQPQPLAKPAQPQPLAKPAQPKPLAQPAQPKPLAQPAQPKPLAQPAQPKPLAKPAQPKPLAKPAQPLPVGKRWCVAKPNTNYKTLQSNIDFACSKGLDCKSINPGGACYDNNNLKSRASYVMNLYYRNKGDCGFSQSGEVTAKDPSKGTCVYA